MPIVVTRSPLRLLVYVLVAIPAVMLAVDMNLSHRFFPLPEGNEVVTGSSVAPDGELRHQTGRQLTAQGAAQQRRALVAGALLLVGGLGAMGWAMRELLWPKVLLRADAAQLTLRIGGRGEPLTPFPWPAIAELRSGVIDDDGEDVPVLSVRLSDNVMMPHDPAGAMVEDRWVHLFSEDWSPPAHEVVPLLEHMRRVSAPAHDDS
ncbi:MAG TPA: hypothetical protein VMM81_07770 [Acidimicrobiia bacterium]|nr:hypothetical protein [Acidimicrobiia bacterium]